MAEKNRSWGDAYPLDPLERHRETKSLECNRDELVVYEGRHLDVHPVRVHPAFAERLARFEELVEEIATEVYGRKPRVLLHMGAYACRSSRLGRGHVSEHALGNAIDLTGFEFGPLPDEVAVPDDLPASLRQSFVIEVEQHWEVGDDVSQWHTRFLRRIATRAAEKSIFRVVLGPGREDHESHLHFDMSPWRHVDL